MDNDNSAAAHDDAGDDELVDVDPADLLDLRFFGDQVLRQVAAPVEAVDDALLETARKMLITMEIEAGVGLAAPQVGIGCRMLVHGVPDTPTEVLINPEILETRGEWVYNEGCLSIPGLYYPLVRPKEILVRTMNLEGEIIEFEADELFSRVIQHELDHLDGLQLVDHLSGPDREAALAELDSWVTGTLGSVDPFLTGRTIKGLRRHPARSAITQEELADPVR